ncbi:MAG: hypothetical protein HONBIEJF_00656 [Fimbriimonadaceae bacterium]|nr:hypothetical protein [Fimbriimonadaceae bacterium]
MYGPFGQGCRKNAWIEICIHHSFWPFARSPNPVLTLLGRNPGWFTGTDKVKAGETGYGKTMKPSEEFGHGDSYFDPCKASRPDVCYEAFVHEIQIEGGEHLEACGGSGLWSMKLIGLNHPITLD